MADRPRVILVSEVTADGKLTLQRGTSSKVMKTVLDKPTEEFFHKQRAECDAIVVGSNTIRIDNSILTVRHVEGKSPLRVIPSSDANIPLESEVLKGDAKTLIVVSEKAPQEKLDALRATGAEIMVAGSDAVDLPLMFQKLFEMGVKRVMVEGGPTLNWHLFQNSLIDEVKIVNIPIIIGGDAPSLVAGEGIDDIGKRVNLKFTKGTPCGNQFITEYDVVYGGAD